MSDPAVAPGSPAQDIATAGAAVGFGATLARARKSAGLSIEEAAARLRLHPRQLDALESEKLQALPASPYVSGFVRNYARELRLDAGPLLDDLYAKLATHGLQGPALDLRSADSSGLPVLDERRWRQLVMSVIIGILVCAGLIGFWMAGMHGRLPDLAGRRSANPAAPAQAAPGPETASSAPQAAQAQAPAIAESAPEASSKDAAPAVLPTAPGGASAGPATTAAAGSSNLLGHGTSAPGNGAHPTGAGLILRFNDRSWVEVSQPDGKVLMSHIGEPGSLELLNTSAPLQLVVGRAEAVQVEYRGQPVDLKPYVNGNGVARLSLADGRISSAGASTR